MQHVIGDVAEEYAQQVKKAEDAGYIVAASIEQIAEQVRETYPFADELVATFKEATLRPQTPLYNDVSLAVSGTLHPLEDIDPEADVDKLRDAVTRALNGEGLL